MNRIIALAKKTIGTPVAQVIIPVCCAVPALRSCCARVGVTPARFGSRVFRVPLRHRGESLQITGADTNHLCFQLFWRGIDYYEPFTRTTVEHLSASADWFLDVGANIGFFALCAARLNPRLRVVAFEPNPKMFAHLSEHKRLNALDNLTPEPVALSNQDGEARLFIHESDMSATLVPGFQEDFNPTLGTHPVRTITLDSFVDQANVSGPVLLKVDVEGHDKAFFEGAQRAIARLKPDIVVEVLTDFDPVALENFRKLGYRFYRITDKGLVQSEAVGLTKIGKFVFLNYLFTLRPPGEIDSISKKIREAARRIDLYQTSKLIDHPV